MKELEYVEEIFLFILIFLLEKGSYNVALDAKEFIETHLPLP